jgi:hypothetical protein
LQKLNQFYFVFDELFSSQQADEKYKLAMEQRVHEWLARFPNSTSAHLAYAQMLLGHAWSIRGPGLVKTVKPENWNPFYQYVEKAPHYLEVHKRLRNDDPRWDLMVLEIAKLQSVSEEEYETLYRAALDRNPGFYQLYFTIVDYYLPKWGGNPNEVERFVNQAVKRTKATEGHALYARIYWAASQSQFGAGMFNNSSVRWEEMKRGIDDVLKDYPDKWNTYNFAMFACFAFDQEKTHELMLRIQNEDITPNWPYFKTYEECRASAGIK